MRPGLGKKIQKKDYRRIATDSSLLSAIYYRSHVNAQTNNYLVAIVTNVGKEQADVSRV